LEFLASHGVDGFVPCGTTGESTALSPEERRAVIALTREVAKSRGLKTIAGCGGNATASVLALIQEAEELGCDAALVVTPYYNKPTQAGLLAHYRYLADHSRLPILLYNVPSRTGVSLAVETTAKLLEHPGIVGIKEASGQYGQWLAIAHQLDTRKSLLAGDDDAFACVLALGGSGTISAAANLVPGLFVAMYRHAAKGELGAAFQIQKKLFPLIKALFAETNPAPLKFALHHLTQAPARSGSSGVLENVLRLPLTPIGQATELLLLEAMRGLETETAAP
jgi:4-hydroxy-tetrahydrodipicolinate synthase